MVVSPKSWIFETGFYATAASAQSGPPHNEIYQHNKEHHNHTNQHHQLNILPPHLPLQPTTPHAKILRPDPQPIRLVDQQIDPLPTLQHPLDILRHDPPHILDLGLRVRDRVRFAPLSRPVPDHQFLELGVEFGGPVRGYAGEVRVRDVIAGQEALFDLDQIAEGDASADFDARDHDVGEAAGGGVGAVAGAVFGGGVGDVVDVVLVVGVG